MGNYLCACYGGGQRDDKLGAQNGRASAAEGPDVECAWSSMPGLDSIVQHAPQADDTTGDEVPDEVVEWFDAPPTKSPKKTPRTYATALADQVLADASRHVAEVRFCAVSACVSMHVSTAASTCRWIHPSVITPRFRREVPRMRCRRELACTRAPWLTLCSICYFVFSASFT